MHRSREKFVGQQLTLADNTTLSLGFQLTAREDSQSLLDLTLHMLDELHCLDFDGRGEEQLKDMLWNMGVMTDTWQGEGHEEFSGCRGGQAERNSAVRGRQHTTVLQCPLPPGIVSSCLQSLDRCGEREGLHEEFSLVHYCFLGPADHKGQIRTTIVKSNTIESFLNLSNPI